MWFIFFFFFQKVDYITYLSIFDQLFDIPKDKKNAAYREWVNEPYINGLVQDCSISSVLAAELLQ